MKSIILDIGEIIIILGIGASGYIVSLVKSYLKKDKFNFNKLLKNDQKVDRLLIELRKYMDADRCSVFQFHNGGSFINGIHMAKASCTHEQVRSGIAPMRKESENILISSDTDFFLQIHESEKSFLVHTDDMKRSESATVLKSRSISHMLICSFKHNNMTEGYIAIDFMSKSISIDDKKLKEAQLYSDNIGMILRS